MIMNREMKLSGSWSILRYCSSSYVRELRKATRNLNQDSQFLGRDSNPEHPEH
jgi:hypothetical protein